ncbi:MAG TPA: hypothetical protein PKH07_07565 [bacterium]|nr:hypothetical protein [bacterium]
MKDKNKSKPKFTGNALDRDEFRKRFLMEMVCHPLSLYPFVLGATLLMASWALTLRSGIAVFAGLAAILGSVGAFCTRLLLGSELTARKVVEQLEKEVQDERERSLDDLERRLGSDEDPRTEAALRDLRTLAKAFRETREWSDSLKAQPTLDILSGVEQLFARCVVLLERTLTLWYTARKITSSEARKPILDQREQIIADIGESIKQLGSILAGIQAIRVGDSGDRSDIRQIRHELDQSLEVAKMVEKRMQAFNQDIDSRIAETQEP